MIEDYHHGSDLGAVMIYLFVGSFDDPERGGELLFWKLNAIESRDFNMNSCCSFWISGKSF